MTCTPDGCRCGHSHDEQHHADHQVASLHAARRETSEGEHGHGAGCCGDADLNEDANSPTVAEKT